MTAKKENSNQEQTATGMIVTGFKLTDMTINAADADVLKNLAAQVAGIASSRRMEEVREHWKKINNLEKTRPIIFCDPENGWNEIITLDQMKCTGLLAKRWEMNLRKEIFWGNEMGDDKPVDAFFNVPYTALPDSWGMNVEFTRTQDHGAARWKSPLQDYEKDLDKIAFQGVNIDWETTKASLAAAHTVFDGILNVRLKGVWWWTLGLTMPAVFLRGLENLMFDFFDEPEGVHELMKRLSDGTLQKLDYLEQHNLLSLNNDATYVGSGGYGFTDQLPASGFDGTVRCRDLWGFAESQETVSVSPEMYEEFVFPYEKPILDRFGLNCYGCCEPLNTRWNVVKKHTNLRRVSCSPWADYEKMAQHLQSDYIFSLKANPSELAVEYPNFDKIRNDLRRNLSITKGCVLEIIMKDNNTLAGKPENLIQWSRIVKEEIAKLY